MNWGRTSSDKFEKLRRFTKDWVAGKNRTSAEADEVKVFLNEVDQAKTIMEIKKAFEKMDMLQSFEDMMMEFFK